MQFESASPSIVRSVKQRDLLNAWLRAFDKRGALPRLEDDRPERVADELADLMGITSKPVPASIVNAVVDRSIAPRSSRHAAADDLVELD